MIVKSKINKKLIKIIIKKEKIIKKKTIKKVIDREYGLGVTGIVK